MYVLALSDYKQHAATAGYKPAPPIRHVYLNTTFPPSRIVGRALRCHFAY